jgi:hypothetical protein
MHPLGQRPILRRHRRNTVEDRLEPVGLLGAFLALGAELRGAFLLIAARSAALNPSDVVWALFVGILPFLSTPQARRDAGHWKQR